MGKLPPSVVVRVATSPFRAGRRDWTRLDLFESLAFALCIGETGAGGAIRHWPVEDGGNSHYYEVVSAPTGITWAGANSRAIERGGYLATITSQAENLFVSPTAGLGLANGRTGDRVVRVVVAQIGLAASIERFGGSVA